MMEDLTGLFGVDIAVKKLRPGAEFALHNTTFIKWECPNDTEPPTWDEIKEQFEKDKLELNTTTET
tara:strand:- start:315 stop:512 length:198 start_codon:yes stop_codon:yes gene_type:complete